MESIIRDNEMASQNSPNSTIDSKTIAHKKQSQLSTDALAKPVSTYIKKSRMAHALMQDIYWGRKTIDQICQETGLSKEKLMIGFAVFGIQAMEISEARGVVCSYFLRW